MAEVDRGQGQGQGAWGRAEQYAMLIIEMQVSVRGEGGEGKGRGGVGGRRVVREKGAADEGVRGQGGGDLTGYGSRARQARQGKDR
jgi:hypothetical protein